MNLSGLFEGAIPSALGPILATLSAILIPMAIAALFKLLQKIGIEIEARHRDALQSALHNAAMIAIQRSTGYTGSTGSTVTGVMKEIVPNVGAGIEYVKNSVPDAMKEFKLDTGRIKDLLEPHLVDAARKVGVTLKK